MNKLTELFQGRSRFYIAIMIVLAIVVVLTIFWLLNSPGFEPVLSLIVTFIIVFVLTYMKDTADTIFVSQKDIQIARERVEQNPEKAKPAWDLATAKLESYLSANIKQINWIFNLSIIVLLIGFGFLAGAVYFALQEPDVITPSIVAGVGGVLTEFIGATFLVLYRSALEHSTNFIKSLDKTSSVGVAMQILDNVYADPDGTPPKIAEAKIEIAKLLLASLSEK